MLQHLLATCRYPEYWGEKVLWKYNDTNFFLFFFHLKVGLVSFGLWLMENIWQNQLRTGIRKYGMPVLRLLILRWSSIICLTYYYTIPVYVTAHFLPLIFWCYKKDDYNMYNCGTRVFSSRLPGKLVCEWLYWHFGIPGRICLNGVERWSGFLWY